MQRIVSAIATLASLAAVIGLCVSLWQSHHDFQTQQIQNWQEVAVYSICLDSGAQGASLDSINQKYQDAAKNLPTAVPREQLNTDVIKRILISLMNKQVIGVRPDNTYAAAYIQFVPPGLPNKAAYDKLAKHLIQLLTGKPHSLNLNQLAEEGAKEFPDLTSQDISLVIDGLRFGNRILEVDGAGKAYLNTSSQK